MINYIFIIFIILFIIFFAMYSEEPLLLEPFDGKAVKDDYIHIDAVTEYVKNLIPKENI